jgi:phosphoribosylamine-glycine ligase
MQEENAPYEGVLFIGIMVVDNEPIVLEYNVRFGDPECEELMPLIDSSVYDMFYYGAKGEPGGGGAQPAVASGGGGNGSGGVVIIAYPT